MLGSVWACLGIIGEVAQVSGRLGYLRRACSRAWTSSVSWASLLKFVGVLATLGEWGEIRGGPWASGAQVSAKLTLKRGEINFKSNEF